MPNLKIILMISPTGTSYFLSIPITSVLRSWVKSESDTDPERLLLAFIDVIGRIP